jgi:putative oxidoreductase
MMNLGKFLFSKQNMPTTAASIGLLLMRLYFGISMASAGYDKVPVPDWMIEQVIELSFPFPSFFAFLACFSEFAGGILIIFGLLTRPAAIFIAITMGVAAFVHHGATPFLQIHVAQDLFWMAVCLAFTGAGKFSIDGLSQKENFKIGFLNFSKIAAIGLGLVMCFTVGKQIFNEPRDPEEPTIIESVSLVGTFNEWDLGKNLMESKGDSIYELDLKLVESGPIAFKFAANQSWRLNMGASNDETTSFPIEGTGKIGVQTNIKGIIPKAGNYIFKLDLKNLSYKVVPGIEE